MNKKQIKNVTSILVTIIALILVLFNTDDVFIDSFASKEGIETKTSTLTDGDLKIYYLDVGQADSILIQVDDKNMLIDAGNNADGDKLVTYFNSLGITSFDYVIGTHAHEDHIGGMDDIINNFNINNFYMPDAITTTSTFEDVLDALDNKSIKFQTPNIDEMFSLGDATVNILYTGTNTSDLNNTSIVFSMKYGSKTYLFMGDATSDTEEEILSKDIKADVIKIGHHGSKYSSSNDFINKVNPKYAIISVGLNNKYNHPTLETLDKLNKMNVEIYRTDELGTILLTSDGNSINFETISTDTNG